MTLKRLVKAYLVILLSIVFPGEFHFSIGNRRNVHDLSPDPVRYKAVPVPCQKRRLACILATLNKGENIETKDV